ncbi:MAG TPA: sterol desaturase family protein [Dokdonella sp.]|uniref:sterol desaturase family protein n=1 Tax=Dokdonella sp. TaxID=2291710 RepID=UPI002D7F708A|nr:sterol desaturase family protein [Dokdonella sp.]HET9031738.1 sterol desaturase family protein [Dokdonella sp.]
MIAWMLDNGAIVRFTAIGSLFLILLAIQFRMPTRGEPFSAKRYLRNLSLPLISALIVYLLLPLTAVSFAAAASDLQLGLFNHLDWPLALEFTITIIALDLAIYWQHRWMHWVPWLWRIHRLHHSDTNFELSMGLRFHPFEIVLSLLYKCLVIAALGAAPIAVLGYEVLLAAFALFSHADIAIPQRWDRQLRKLVITPDWHRAHHSIHRAETDSNYGNLLSIWDRLFVSVTEQPRDGHRQMQIGLNQFRDEASQRLPAMLLLPFVNDHTPSKEQVNPHA